VTTAQAQTGNTFRQAACRTGLSILVALAGLLVLLALAPGRAAAAAPQISNGSNWLESQAATGGPGSAPGTPREVTVSLMVKHDVGRRIDRIKIDDDYNGTDNTAAASVRTLTASQWQQPTIVGGYAYTRVTYSYNVPAGSDVDCPFVGAGSQYQVRPLRIRALDDTGQESATTSANITFVRYDCNARQDAPVIYQRGQDKQQIDPGESVHFTFTGDDSDGGLTANRDFGGIRYRLRRLSDGATTGTTDLCFGNSDNTQRGFDVTFPNRGRWVVEALLLNNAGCDYLELSGTWWRIGSVDVNSPASSSPNISLSATRPILNGNTTVTATVNDSADAGQGGVGQDIEWDDNNDGTYDGTSLGDWLTGLTAPQRQRTINTTGFTPGIHTVAARIGDNGALGGADTIRRTKVATTTFLVDTPPVALDDNVQTETGDPVAVTLAGTDVDSDTLTYSIVTPPAHGTLTGSGASRTYTPDPGYAGMDSFTFQANDGYGGTDTADVTLRVDPDLKNVSGPSGTVNSRGGNISFDSSATGATFECQLDGGTWDPCVAPVLLTDRADGPHSMKVRVTAGGLTNPSDQEVNWTVDAFPAVAVNAGPDPVTSQTSVAVDFTLSEAGATVTPTSECRLDLLDWVPCISPVAYEDLDDGSHKIRIRATDAFGKQTVQDVDWEVLTDGGSVAIDAPLPPTYTRETSAEINFTASGPSDHTECMLDGASWQLCSSPAGFTGLAEGEHTVRVRSVNQLGNPGSQPAQVSWVVDRNPPVASFVSGPEGPAPNGPATFVFQSSESFSSFECKLDAGDYEPCSSPFDLPLNLSDGDHSLRIAAIDRAGNRSLAPRRDFRLLSAASPPAIVSGPVAGSVENSSAATFGFTTSGPVAGFECRLDGGDFVPCASPAAVTGLNDGSHTFVVRSFDEVGNRSAVEATRSWNVDTVPPAARITDGPNGRTATSSAAFRLDSSEAGSSFECSLDGGAYAACASPVNLTGLSEGAHQFRVRATDPAGNTGPGSDSRAWTVDTSAPQPPEPPLPDPEDGACDFKRERERCGDPYMVASARASYRKKGGKGSISIDLDSGQVALAKIVAKTPSGLETVAVSGSKGRKIGQLTLSGSSTRKLTLKLPKKVKSGNVVARKGGVTVTLKPRSLVITGLPPGTTGAKIRLKQGKGLALKASLCGTKTWRSVLTDLGAATRLVSTKGDISCVRKGNR